MSLRVAVAGPGDFHLGINSRCRGEMRWWINGLKVLSKDPQNEVAIIGQCNKTYKDNEYRIYFLNIDEVISGHSSVEFDVLFSMDPYKNIGLPENWMSDKVSKIKTKKRVFAPFFGSTQHYACTIPVVYPYYYQEINNIQTFCVPACFGTKEQLYKKSNFNEPNIVWFSKNSHENPDFLLASFKAALDFVIKKNGKLIIIDGKKLTYKEYKDHEEIKGLMKQYKDRIWYTEDEQWLPYNKMKYVLNKSKFITGIHHPVCNPMQLDVVFDGGLPIVFENQISLPPFDSVKNGVYYVPYGREQEDYIKEIYNKYEDEGEFNAQLGIFRNAAEEYTDEVFLKKFYEFVEKI